MEVVVMAAQSCSRRAVEIVLSGLIIGACLIAWRHFEADNKPKDVEKTDIPGVVMIWSKEKRQWAHNNRTVLKPEEYQKYCGYVGEFCQFD